MAVPNLTIAAEPIEAGKAVYSPLAAKAADQVPQVKIVLRLRITNDTAPPQVVVVNAIQFSFPGSAAPSKNMQGIPLVLDPDGPHDGCAGYGRNSAGRDRHLVNGE